MSDAREQLADWKRTHLVDPSPVRIPTRYLRDPANENLHSRVRSEPHTILLEALLKDDGWSPAHAASVVRFDSQSKPYADLTASELEQGFYVISGDHRRAAIQRLQQNFARNVLFSHVPCIHYSCPDTQANRNMLIVMGSDANTAEHTIRRVEFYDKYLLLRGLLGRGGAPKDPQLKATYSSAWKVSPSQISHILTMLRREPAVEEYGLRWVQGEVIWRASRKADDLKFDPDEPKNTRPDSLGALVHLGSLQRVEDQLALLHEVFSGQVPSAKIKTRIDYLAIARFLKDETAVHLDIANWEAGLESHPTICNEQTLATYVPAVQQALTVCDADGKQKKGKKSGRMVFPASLKSMIHNSIHVRHQIQVF